jgi:geranylgeranyl pyrophosphate synthase
LTSPDNHKREALRPCLLESGGVAYAHRRAEELAAQARRELTCLQASTCRSVLEALTERVVNRNA